jgi:hypothetical protein
VRRLPARVLVLVAVVVVVVLAVGAFVVVTLRDRQREVANAPTPISTDLATVLAGPHVLFRNTLTGEQYGLVAAVALDDPSGARAFTSVRCDRLYAAGGTMSCLRTIPGVATTYEGETLDASTFASELTWPLPGIPSRTRVSPDGTLIATTAFVTGHSYAQVGFSTETRIRTSDGTDLGDFETWSFVVDGQDFTASDRNFWGVSFVDDNLFYATAQSQSADKTWIVTGDVATKTLTTLREGGECPSVSPDHTRVAYKKVVRVENAQKVWAYAILDLASDTETLYPVTAGCDDQIEWLDDDTILYGVPRAGETGVTDIWSLDVSVPDAEPQLFIEGAWSPAVVR